jgi:hypothetical protein
LEIAGFLSSVFEASATLVEALLTTASSFISILGVIGCIAIIGGTLGAGLFMVRNHDI